MSASTRCPPDHPLMLAWSAHQATEDFENSKRWAAHPEHLQGSLWGLFMAGFNAATARAAALHESVNPASDQERHEGSPGAGAMGAVIEYRDLIRSALPRPSDLEREERAHGVTIDQRDAAESALSEAYLIVTGQPPEWSNRFGYREALDDIRAALPRQAVDEGVLRAQLERVVEWIDDLTDGGVLEHALEVKADCLAALAAAQEGVK